MYKIIIPEDKQKREYVLYLYKNRNNFHNMNDKDINNLLKLMNIGKLNDNDYPKNMKKEKTKKAEKQLNSFNIDNNREDFSFIL